MVKIKNHVKYILIICAMSCAVACAREPYSSDKTVNRKDKVNVENDAKAEKMADDGDSDSYCEYVSGLLEEEVAGICDVKPYDCDVELNMSDGRVISVKIEVDKEDGDNEELKSKITDYASSFLDIAQENISVIFE